MMKTVRVSKADLIEKIKTNREEHRAIFERAQQAYRTKVIELLDQRLSAASSGGEINLWFSLPEPEEHTADYDAALDALEWEVEEYVTLDAQSFRQLVRNEWGWATSFAANTSAYLA